MIDQHKYITYTFIQVEPFSHQIVMELRDIFNWYVVINFDENEMKLMENSIVNKIVSVVVHIGF